MWKWPSVIAIAAVAAVAGLALRLTELTPPRVTSESDLINSIGMAFVLIPAGEFMMGTPKAQSDVIAGDDAWYRATFQRETPPRRIVIAQPFYMGKYEVTQAQWQAVMGQNPSRFPGDGRPVENVSWQDVQVFIKKLNERERQSSGIFCRLPTEAEWEYAARAGTPTLYSFGDDAARLDDYAWHSGNAGWGAHPVGGKKPNAWGLYDMHGNVLEWCQDRYRPYRAGGAIESSYPGAGRIMRGGSWRYPPPGARSAHRYQLRPDYHNGYLGFRCLSAGPSLGNHGATLDGQGDDAWRQLAYTP